MRQTVAREGSTPTHEIRCVHDQKVPMRDGVRLSVDLILPHGPGPFPALLHRTPYESNADRWISWAKWFAKRGYAVLSGDCRGRYESEGVFYAYADEGRDGHDTLEWIAHQPWCSGVIGTWGRSYGAIAQWQTAPLDSPYLTCMAPHAICDDYFSDYHYVGGAFQLTLSIMAAICFTTSVSLTTQEAGAELFNTNRLIRSLPLIDMDVRAIGKEIPFWRDWLAHPTNDAYWHALRTTGRFDRIDVPVFQQSGWYDAYANSLFDHYTGITMGGKSDRARKNQKLLMGPWSHGVIESSRMGELDFGPAAFLDLREVELRWYDHWLKGMDTDVVEEPPISIFVMGANEWRYEREWPLARTEPVPWYLHSGGKANSRFGDGTLSPEPPGAEPPDRYAYDPERPVVSIGGNNSTQLWSAKAEEPIVPGPIDQRVLERRDDVLVYTSAPLERDLEVTGPLTMTLYAASSARDTDWTAKLVDVYPNGYAMNLAEGIIRARYRNGDDREELLPPGEVQRYAMRMYPTSNVFKRGHRIRLDISSSNFPRFSRNLNTGEPVATGTRSEIAHQTVLHTAEFPSHITLPVIPGGTAGD